MKPSRKPRKLRLLGDAVHAVAAPVARVLDAVLGTDLQHCPSCAARRAALNRKGWRFAPPPPSPRDTPAE